MAANCSNGVTFQAVPRQAGLCWHWRRHGVCPHAATCQFRHEDREVEGPAAKPQWFYWMYRMPEDPSEYELLVKTFHLNGFALAQTDEERLRSSVFWSGTSTLPRIGLPEHGIVNRVGGGTHITHKDR